jgi:hypothetical protein
MIAGAWRRLSPEVRCRRRAAGERSSASFEEVVSFREVTGLRR